MKYEHNNNLGLFKFQSGYRKIYLNSPKGYSRKIINMQTACMPPTINILCVFSDEVFLPKSESDMEGGEMDEFEKELEEFKR